MPLSPLRFVLSPSVSLRVFHCFEIPSIRYSQVSFILKEKAHGLFYIETFYKHIIHCFVRLRFLKEDSLLVTLEGLIEIP